MSSLFPLTPNYTLTECGGSEFTPSLHFLMSPGDLVTLVSEALDGLTVIQAYGKQAYFVQITSDYINDAHRTLFGSESLNLWLAFYCDFYGE